MNDPKQSFSEVLQRHVSRFAYTPGQLARLSAVSKMTIVHWLQGHVKRPRAWEDVVKLSRALRLNRVEADELLHAAGHPPVASLQTQFHSEGEREWLSFWPEERTSPGKPPPFQVIPNLSTFVGREPLLQTLQELLLADQHDTVYVLEGMAGVGKTALAARLAYRLRPYLPDGVLWARLDAMPDPMTILRLFADAYERDVSTYDDLGSRSTAVRELLADKRALVVLDNVSGSAEIEPLLPPSGPCVVLITTRRRNLTIARGANRFYVEPFCQGESLALFAKVVGEEAVARERIALLKLSELLGHLPLAVDIVACRLANEPNQSANALMARLRRESERLNGLVYEERSVRAAFEASYALLSPEQQKLFAVAGTFGGRDFRVEAAATVANLPIQQTELNLRELHSLSFVRRGRSECYRLIPLLQTFAEEKTAAGAMGECSIR